MFFQNDVWKSESCKISQFSWTIREYHVRELGQDQAAMQVMSLTNSEQCSHVCQRRQQGVTLMDVSCYIDFTGAQIQQNIWKVASSCLFASSQEDHVHSFPHVRLVVSMLKPFTKLIKVCWCETLKSCADWYFTVLNIESNSSSLNKKRLILKF